ncbi:MAG: class I poly(R)-hydroxyalkanoic acid synthase [Betaproteobacteria bacterium]|nr:class I poly(R)-hydroxyalkanoic acid synthase [Betaproteobacteria bacterium]MSQ88915.1 class I poly(R)-hydroxyalkanoic acid synthase [Betaproteobacteria bacterium]
MPLHPPHLTAIPPEMPDAAAWMSSLLVGGAQFGVLQSNYIAQQAQLWSAMLDPRTSAKALAEPVVAPQPGDRRFAAAEWRDNPYFSYLQQSYLLSARFLSELAQSAELEAKSRERLQFAVQQWCDAMCPTNFAATNPAVLKRALDSGGASLTQGIANLITDLHQGRISQTDEAAFEVGRNLALTPGTVVYENDLIQLIQYQAATPQVGVRPLVIVPPCINKYYILDLRPENSFVRYALGQGHTVFVVSWRNVGSADGPLVTGLGWDDYLELGIFSALRVAREITGADRVNALGFCVGGTLLAAALAVQAAKGEKAVESVTYLATMLDFSAPGQLGVFIDEKAVAAREAAIGGGGILPGADLASAFNALRANDLIWPYVVNNYLLGSAPAAFDLLYWNADSTNLPGPMYCTYLRNTYLENKLCVPGALHSCGVSVDLGRVDRPTFILATREDHIVPWRAAYRALALLGGEKKFVLGASGHIAGVINPASGGKRSYWISDLNTNFPADAEAWLAQARAERGSWWPQWSQWLETFKGGTRDAPAHTGNARYPVIEPAPGRYVKQKA